MEMEMLQRNNNTYQEQVSQQVMFLKAYMYEGKLYVNGEDFIKYNERFSLDFTGNDDFYYYEIERSELENASRKLSSSEVVVKLQVEDMPEKLVASMADIDNLISRNENFKHFDDQIKESVLRIESQLHDMDYDTYMNKSEVISNTLMQMNSNANIYFINEMSRILNNETNRKINEVEKKKR